MHLKKKTSYMINNDFVPAQPSLAIVRAPPMVQLTIDILTRVHFAMSS
jgi:hypothetical protein